MLPGGSAPSEPFSEDERVWSGSYQRTTLDRGKLDFVLRDVEDHENPGTNAHFNTILSLDIDHGIYVNSHLTTAHGAYTNLNGRVNLGADIGATINAFAPVKVFEPLTVSKHLSVGRYINLSKIVRGTPNVGDIWVEDTSLEDGGTSTDVKVQTGDKTVNLSNLSVDTTVESLDVSKLTTTKNDGYYLRIHKDDMKTVAEDDDTYTATWQQITIQHLDEWYASDDPRRIIRGGAQYLKVPNGSEVWGLGWLQFNTPYSNVTKIGGFESYNLRLSEGDRKFERFENVLNFNVMGQKAMAISALSKSRTEESEPTDEVVEIFGRRKPLFKLVDTLYYSTANRFTRDIGSIYFDSRTPNTNPSELSIEYDQVTFAEIKGQAERSQETYPVYDSETRYFRGDRMMYGTKNYELQLSNLMGLNPDQNLVAWKDLGAPHPLDRGKLEFVLRDTNSSNLGTADDTFLTILSLDIDHGIFVNSHLTTAHGAYANFNGNVNLGATVGAIINMFADTNMFEPVSIKKRINLVKTTRDDTPKDGDIWAEEVEITNDDGTKKKQINVNVQTGNKKVNLSNVGGGTSSVSNLIETIDWKLPPTVTLIPAAGQVGIGPDVATNLFFNVPDEKYHQFRINNKVKTTLYDDKLLFRVPIQWEGAGPLGDDKTLKDLDQNASGITLNSSDNMILRVASTKHFSFTGNMLNFMKIYPGRIHLDNNTTNLATATFGSGTIWRDKNGDVKISTGRPADATARPPIPNTLKTVNLTTLSGGTASLTGLKTDITWLTSETNADARTISSGSVNAIGFNTNTSTNIDTLWLKMNDAKSPLVVQAADKQ